MNRSETCPQRSARYLELEYHWVDGTSIRGECRFGCVAALPASQRNQVQYGRDCLPNSYSGRTDERGCSRGGCVRGRPCADAAAAFDIYACAELHADTNDHACTELHAYSHACAFSNAHEHASTPDRHSHSSTDRYAVAVPHEHARAYGDASPDAHAAPHCHRDTHSNGIADGSQRLHIDRQFPAGRRGRGRASKRRCSGTPPAEFQRRRVSGWHECHAGGGRKRLRRLHGVGRRLPGRRDMHAGNVG